MSHHRRPRSRGRRLHPQRWPHRPQRARIRAGKRRAQPRMRIPDADGCDRHRRARRPGARRGNDARHDSHPGGGQRRRGLVLARRPHDWCGHPHCAHRAPVHDDGAVRRAARPAHLSRSGPAHLWPRRSRRPAGGRVRRESDPLRSGAYPGRFDPGRHGAELGPLRAAGAQRGHPHPRAQRRGHSQIDDRP